MFFKLIQKSLCLLLVLPGLCSLAHAGENPGVPWPATDALGRSLPLAAETGLPKTNRFVGIFYFINHNGSPRFDALDGPYDFTKILERDPEVLKKSARPIIGASRCLAIIWARIRGCCGVTRNCWPTRAWTF